MVTEVQLSNSRLHFQYLQRLISEFAGSVGMSCRDIEDMVKAITDVCVVTLKSMSNVLNGKLSVMLVADASCMTVEIVDRYTMLGSGRRNEHNEGDSYSYDIESARPLVDAFELVKGNDELTIRLTKTAKAYDSPISLTMSNVPSLEVTALTR